MSWSRGRQREWWTSLESSSNSGNREPTWSRLWYTHTLHCFSTALSPPCNIKCSPSVFVHVWCVLWWYFCCIYFQLSNLLYTFKVTLCFSLLLLILSGPVHLHPWCYTGVSHMWRYWDWGWGPEEETGSTQDQRWVWSLWTWPTVCRKIALNSKHNCTRKMSKWFGRKIPFKGSWTSRAEANPIVDGSGKSLEYTLLNHVSLMSASMKLCRSWTRWVQT